MDNLVTVHNNLTKTLEILPVKHLLWYLCGPTVYDSAHLGHARTYLTMDIIKRILIDYFQQPVTLIMNITNIDDKIINRAKSENRDHLELANHYEQLFYQDMSHLNVSKPEIITRVTDYIPEMIQFVQKLIDTNHAYVANGSVYYDLTRFLENEGRTKKHFQLPEQTTDEQLVSTHRDEKKNQNDFALWKKTEPDTPGWETPWGYGRPGWHLECSVMSITISQQLQRQGKIDIHSGGIDLAFPHHHNEILQSESYLFQDDASEKSWCPRFLHIGHLNIKGAKMSKSLKNFISIENWLKNNHPDDLRMFFAMYPYRKTINYDPEIGVEEAKNLRLRIVNFLKFVNNWLQDNQELTIKDQLPNHLLYEKLITNQKEFKLALSNDFDTQEALNVMLAMIDQTYEAIKTNQVHWSVIKVSEWILSVYSMLGFSNPIQETGQGEAYLLLIRKIRDEIRNLAKIEKNQQLYQLSDRIRDQYLKDLGVDLQDLK